MYKTFAEYFDKETTVGIEDIKSMITDGVDDLDDGLIGACYGGHQDIIELMIDKGADDWDYGLVSACYGGHIEIVKLMIMKGACKWKWGLKSACKGGHIEIVKLMIDRGATNLDFLEWFGNGDLRVYRLCMRTTHKDIDKDKYTKLVREQCAVYCLIGHKRFNKSLNKIPPELFRLTHTFF